MADEQNTHVFKAISPDGGVVQIEIEIPKRIRDAAQKTAREIPPIVAENSANGILGRLRFLFNKIRNLPFIPTKKDTKRVVVLVVLVICLVSFVIFPLWLGLSGGLSSDKDIIKSKMEESIRSSGQKPFEAKTPAERKRIAEEEKKKQEEAARIKADEEQLKRIREERLKEEARIKAEQEAKIKAEEEKKKQEEAARIKAEQEQLKQEEEEKNRLKTVAESHELTALNYFLEDYFSARKNIDKCIELNPKNPVYRGWKVLIQRRFPQKANQGSPYLDSFEREGYVETITTVPDEPSEYFARGVAYFMLGLNNGYYASAVKDFKQCRDSWIGISNDPICYYFLYLTYSKLGDKEAADYNLQKFKVLEQGVHLEVFNRDEERRYRELKKIREQDGAAWTEQEKQIIQHVEECLFGKVSCSTSRAIDTLYTTGKSIVKYFGWVLLYYEDIFHLQAIEILKSQYGSSPSWYLMEEALYCPEAYDVDHRRNQHPQEAIEALVEKKAVTNLCQIALYAKDKKVRSYALEQLVKFKNYDIVLASLRLIAKFDEDYDNKKRAEQIVSAIEIEKQFIKHSP